jgi:hypothetical protein
VALAGQVETRFCGACRRSTRAIGELVLVVVGRGELEFGVWMCGSCAELAREWVDALEGPAYRAVSFLDRIESAVRSLEYVRRGSGGDDVRASVPFPYKVGTLPRQAKARG